MPSPLISSNVDSSRVPRSRDISCTLDERLLCMFMSCHQNAEENYDRKAVNTHLYVESMAKLKQQ
jgi:hypothetical protein